MSSPDAISSEPNPLDRTVGDPPSDLRELEQCLQSVTAELNAAYAEMDELARFLSHDLRAPLRGIDGYSRALMEDYGDKLDPVGMAYLQYIFEGSRQAAALIDKLIYYIRSRNADLEIQDVDLSKIASDLIEQISHAQPDRNVTWVVTPGLSTRADFGMINTLLKNLLENAFKFTSKMEAAHIEVGQAQAESGPAFFVRDDGIGFDPAYASRLFQPFQRLHSGHEFDGVGMGLAIARRIVERHHGHIWAEGTLNQGATVYFTIER